MNLVLSSGYDGQQIRSDNKKAYFEGAVNQGTLRGIIKKKLPNSTPMNHVASINYPQYLHPPIKNVKLIIVRGLFCEYNHNFEYTITAVLVKKRACQVLGGGDVSLGCMYIHEPMICIT